MSLALERLGRPEALAHAALARLKDPSPWTTLHHLRLELLFGTKPFPEVLEEAEPFLPHPFPGVRMLAGHTLALTHLLRGSSGGPKTSSGASSLSWSRQASRASSSLEPWP